MSQQAAKRRRRQFAIGFRNVAPAYRKYSRSVRNSIYRAGSDRGKKSKS